MINGSIQLAANFVLTYGVIELVEKGNALTGGILLATGAVLYFLYEHYGPEKGQ